MIRKTAGDGGGQGLGHARTGHWPRETQTRLQVAERMRTPARAPARAEGPGEPLPPAPQGTRPREPSLRQDGHGPARQVLVVRPEREATPLPFLRWVRGWAPQLRKLWKSVGGGCGWKHRSAPRAKTLFEKATPKLLTFLRDTRVGEMWQCNLSFVLSLVRFSPFFSSPFFFLFGEPGSSR